MQGNALCKPPDQRQRHGHGNSAAQNTCVVRICSDAYLSLWPPLCARPAFLSLACSHGIGPASNIYKGWTADLESSPLWTHEHTRLISFSLLSPPFGMLHASSLYYTLYCKI